MFAATSRYANLEIATYETPDGRILSYVRRRFVPVSAGALVARHTVVERDRLDNIAAQYLGDPEQFWRICDTNAAMRPDELTERIGRPIDIALSTGS